MTSLITLSLAVGSVGLWTLRVALTARGSKALGSTVAATEAVVFVVAFSHVTGSLNAPLQIGIYGLGVGIGTYLGVTVDGRIRAREDRHRATLLAVQTSSVDHEPPTTVRSSPGTSSSSPSGVSSAHMTSPGDP